MPFTLTTQEVSEQLRLSDSTLRRLRRDGVLKPGLHFRAIGSGTVKPSLLWDAAATDTALAQRSRRALR
jgi:hypothetical protein